MDEQLRPATKNLRQIWYDISSTSHPIRASIIAGFHLALIKGLLIVLTMYVQTLKNFGFVCLPDYLLAPSR